MSDAAGTEHRAWLGEMLSEAAAGLQANIVGEPVYGWRDRSVAAATRTREGQRWLRVVCEQTEWTKGGFWTGNAEASRLRGVAKPTVLRTLEWVEGLVSVRAELMTLASGIRCSQTPELRTPLELPPVWWENLSSSLAALGNAATSRIATPAEDLSRRVLAFFGATVDLEVQRWTPAHADLHWANLMTPHLSIVDWEGWGLAPAGYDAATLYLHTLLVPETAASVRSELGSVLDSRDGLVAQLAVAARLLERVLAGDYPDLAGPLHHNAETVIASLRPRRPGR